MIKVSNKFQQIRLTLAHHQLIAQQTISAGDRYRVDRDMMQQYLQGVHPLWLDKINQYTNSLKEDHIEFSCVDICGRTSGKWLGADITYCFSLNAQDYLSRINKDSEYINGNLFSSFDFNRLITAVKDRGIKPALITFEPVAGLQSHNPSRIKIPGAPDYKEITYAILGRRLKEAIKLLRPGGYIYISRPFQFVGEDLADAFNRVPDHKHNLTLKVRGITRKMKCTVEVQGTIDGPRFLIRKKETAA